MLIVIQQWKNEISKGTDEAEIWMQTFLEHMYFQSSNRGVLRIYVVSSSVEPNYLFAFMNLIYFNTMNVYSQSRRLNTITEFLRACCSFRQGCDNGMIFSGGTTIG